MSGSFTQRGDICISDKYTRAKHAILGGADCVLELPAAFSVAPAEIFARGAIKMLSSIPDFTALSFGCESADIQNLLSSARILNDEPANFKEILAQNLKEGQSFIKSRQAAFEAVGGNGELLNSPNNVLAVEYVKAILKTGKNIEIYPVKRIGAGYNDENLTNNYSSASAIRKNLKSPEIANNVPPYVLNDIKDFSSETDRYEEFLRLILTRTDAETLKKIYGCTEGLENTLKKCENENLNKIIENVTSKRYSSARIKRILCANFLRLYISDCESYLNSSLYLKPLAVKKQASADILAALSLSDFPLITSGSDVLKLNEIAKKCKNSDDFAFKQWKIIANSDISDKLLII